MCHRTWLSDLNLCPFPEINCATSLTGFSEFSSEWLNLRTPKLGVGVRVKATCRMSPLTGQLALMTCLPLCFRSLLKFIRFSRCFSGWKDLVSTPLEAVVFDYKYKKRTTFLWA